MLLSEIAGFLEMMDVASRGVDLFAGEIPMTAPAAAIGIVETGGTAPSFVHNQETPNVVSPSVQVVTRAEDYETARLRIDEVVKTLTFRNRLINGVRYLSVIPTQEPLPLGRDANERFVFVCNFEIIKEPS
jgi:Bacteriophage minor capsid protein